MEQKWHIPDIKTVESQLKTDISEGLAIRDASIRLDKEKRSGKRKYLFSAQKSSPFKSVFAFLLSPSVILLTIISLLALAFGQTLQGLVILLITLVGAAIGGWTAFKSTRRFEAARDYASPKVKVKRGGNKFYTDGRNIVVGDVIILSKGDLLPCDARIVRSSALVVKELVSTKKGVRNRVVEKRFDVTYDESDGAVAPEVVNMLYAGSAVVSGEAVAIVTATGNDVYLSEFLPDGALGGRDIDAHGVRLVTPTLQKIIFICAGAIVILSLLSLVTLPNVDFISKFMMLLSSVVLVSFELLSCTASNIISTRIKRISKPVKPTKKNKKDISCAIRGVDALDTLTEVTDLVLVGQAGLSDGVFHFSGAFTASGVLDELTPKSKKGNRLLTCTHTYIKALKESGIENSFIKEGYYDSAYSYLKNCGFDISGASLIIKSLYFASEGNGENGYACAETTEAQYRVALTFDAEILKYCSCINDTQGIRKIMTDDKKHLSAFCNEATERGARCLYVVTEQNGDTVLEGVISLEQRAPRELAEVVPALKKSGIGITVLLGEENNKTARLVSDPELALIFDGKIAYASEFSSAGKDITDSLGDYRAYIGFGSDDYIRLVNKMKSAGSKVAAYGIDDNINPILAEADIAISCDLIHYSSEKYKESVFERLAPEGRDTNLRCSQQTRLLSGVIVRRTHENGGGLHSVLHAINASRGAYVSLAQAMLLFVSLMCTLLPFVAVSTITGVMLIDPMQTAAFAVCVGMMSMLTFTDAEHKRELIERRTSYTKYPIELLSAKLPSLIARAAAATLVALTVKILDATSVFDVDANYTVAIFLSIILIAFVELSLINREFTKRGEGRRRCWMRAIFAYAALLAVCAVSTQQTPGNIGTLEFLILPAYILIYVLSLAIAHLVTKFGKKK